MMKRWVAASIAVVLGAGAGAGAGFFWTVNTENDICNRVLAECGDQAMNLDDCLQGRQQDLLRYGITAMRRVNACLASAPHDCMSVSACLAAAEPTPAPR